MQIYFLDETSVANDMMYDIIWIIVHIELLSMACRRDEMLYVNRMESRSDRHK